MVEVPDPPCRLASTPTPIERLAVLSERDDTTLYVKRDDRTAGVAQGNKIRKLEYELGRALERDADVVITCGGTNSNHCRATALLARRLGLASHLVLLGEEPSVPDGNLLLGQLAASTIEYVPETEFVGWDPLLERAADRYRAPDRELTPHVIPLGASSPRGTLGYVRAYEEIADFAASEGVQFDRLVVATGSGGTQAGLVAGSLLASGPPVVGVDVTPYGPSHQTRTVRELVEGVLDQLDASVNADRIESAVTVRGDWRGPGYGEPAPADLEAIATAGQTEGLVLDPTYTAKAFRAFRELTAPGETALFVHTGGSYGLYPHREAFAGQA